MSEEAKQRCCEQVSDRQPWPRFHQCRRAAVITRDGKPYCKQHDPEAIKARRDASYQAYRATFDAKFAAERERNRRADAFPELLAACEEAIEALELAGTPHGRLHDLLTTAVNKAKGQ